MSESLFALLRDPALSTGIALSATTLVAAAAGAIVFLTVKAQRRIEQIDAAQAEAAMRMMAEVKRLSTMVTQQRAEEIGEVLRRGRAEAKQQDAARPRGGDAYPLRQPLRKTIH